MAGPPWPRSIAIVGMACRAPGARTLGSFWRNLCAGVESIHFFDDSELRTAGVPEAALRDPHYVKAAPVLEDFDRFDAGLFHCPPREAAWLDPQHRQFLECAWEALEDAGCDPFRYPGAIGLFAGAGGSVSSYLFALAERFRDYVGGTASGPHLGNDKDFLTTRVSYKLNLRGPSANVQTACSTSLAAVHLACQSILAGDSDMALAGGVSVRVPQAAGYFAREGDIVSPDGHCRPFDACARGTLFGSGVGVVVLKPLDAAVADGDHVYAVIRGTAMNNDGSEKLSYAAASVEGQERCIRAAFVAAGVEPATVGYVEAHGTATALGDPVEVDALNRVFGRRGRCGVGSVKGNVGHLEAAAGIIGLIKAALMLKHGRLVPSINCSVPNPRIDFTAGPFQVQTQLADWPRAGNPRRAGVNALGVGGTNAHAILEEAPALSPDAGPDRGVHLLCLSAQSDEALTELAGRYADALAQPGMAWADVCHTANTGRARLDRRLALLAGNTEEAAQRLREFAAGRKPPGLWLSPADSSTATGFSASKLPAADDAADWSELLAQVAAAYTRGGDVDWASLERGLPPRRNVPLPTYPFRRDRHWIAGGRAGVSAAAASLLGPPRSSPLSGETSYESAVDVELFPVLADHRIFGRVLAPGATYLAMTLTAGASSTPQVLANVEFTRPLVLPDGQTFALQLMLGKPDAGGRRFHAFARGEAGDWGEHIIGQISADRGTVAATVPHRPAGMQEFAGTELYDGFRKIGLDLGPAFQVVRSWWRGDGVLAELAVPPALDGEWDRYFIHPAVLDGCFQLVVGNLASATDALTALFLPLHIDRIAWYRRPGREFSCRVTMRPCSAANEQTVTADLTLFDAAGVLAEITGFTGKRAGRAALLRAGRPDLDEWLHAVTWRPMERKSFTVSASQRWLIVADATGVAEKLAQQLLASGHSIAFARDEVLDRLPGGEFDGVVQLRALDADSGSPAEQQERLLGGMLTLVQTLLKQYGPKPPRLWLVTRGAQAVEPDAAGVAVAQASLWGFAQALKQEQPELGCHCLDLDPRRPSDEIDDLMAELLAGDNEDRVVLRDRRFVARLTPLGRPSAGVPDGPFRLAVSRRGTLDNLRLEPIEAEPPGPGQVQIQVQAAGLNFRDVLNALGLYPGDPGELGMECAGTVCAFGPGVVGLQVGDPVFALAQGSLASVVTTPTDLVVRKPDNLTFAEAAAIPVVFATAEIGLARLAKLRRGERVLVHGATGGVGWAAIQIARRVGAELYATASRGKWDYLRSLGVEHISDSRSLEFAAEVREATGGRGVDVLLNSLAGDFIPASLDVLAPGGRLLEIGKQGIWSHEQVAQRRPDVAYHVLALDRMMADTPAEAGAVLRDLASEFASGKLQPPPVAAVPVSDAAMAFRKMQQARHVGKIVIQMPATGKLVRRDATYLVTGGTGGLGLEVASWLAGQGARHLLLIGRREPSDAARRALARLERDGVRVKFIAADVSDEAALRTALADVEPPLRGLVHTAGVVDDGLVGQQTWSRFRGVLAPKVAGAWILHRLTRDQPLDFFVLFSSVSAVLGSAGQTGYAAANAFLDALASERRRQGLPAVSIAWGPWADAGMAARLDPALRQLWADRGFQFIRPDLGRDLLEQALGRDAAAVGAFRVDWPRYRAGLNGRPSPLLADVAATPAPPVQTLAPTAVATMAGQLAAADPAERRRLLKDYLGRRVVHVLGLGAAQVPDEQTPLPDLGLDSLMTVELLHGLRTELKGVLTLPPTLLFDHPTIAGLVEHLAGRLDGEPRSQEPRTQRAE
ncbi:MAG: SDR family NAD(P)-dependent oxidoreductase [Gemmataceae bacterium]